MNKNIKKNQNESKSLLIKLLEIVAIFAVIILFISIIGKVVVGVFDVVKFNFVKECQAEETSTANCYKFTEAKIIEIYRAGKRNREHYIKFLRDDKKIETSQMFYTDFWQTLKANDLVKVQIWQDSIINVQKGDESAPTSIYPKFDLYNISLDDIVVRFLIIGGFIFIICFLVYNFIRQRKS